MRSNQAVQAIGEIVNGQLILSSWNENNRTYVSCQCMICGQVTNRAYWWLLKTRKTLMCGSMNKGSCKVPGGYAQQTYRSWAAMIQRCTNPNTKNYVNYGGRGIEICDRWRNFYFFWLDMGERPIKHQLDRLDNAGMYEPTNCRWVTQTANLRNTRRTIHVTLGGRKMCLSEACRILSLHLTTVTYYLQKYALTAEEALIKCISRGLSKTTRIEA